MKTKHVIFTSSNIKQTLLYLTLATSFSANADFLSFSVGAGVWNETPEGTYQKTGDPTEVSVTDSLFWGKESQGYIFATVEHPAPLLPNIKVAHTKIEHDGNGNTPVFTFNGTNFSGRVINDVSIESLDLYAYYEILDNVVSLDLGLDIRNLKIAYDIEAKLGPITTDSERDSVSATFPMLYAMVGATPWPGLTISGELSYIAYSGNSISDFTAKIAYTTDYYAGLELGYRKQNYELDEVSDTDADLSFDGVFAGAYLKF